MIGRHPGGAKWAGRRPTGGLRGRRVRGRTELFSPDFSNKNVSYGLLNRLLSHPRVLLTAHQGFLTEEALRQIVRSLLNQFSFYDNQQGSLTTKASMY
jgi:D-lactate dehydrogenase